MTAHRWRNSSGHLIRTDGHHVRCDTCPCEGCQEGSALYKIKYAEQDTSCAGGSGNEYRLNITCECKCLITGTVPDPIPEGKTPADYYESYPITGGSGAEGDPRWKRTLAGGPFATQALCDAYQVDGCCGSCGWYKIRKAYYDADCLDVNNGYNDTPECSCRCLIGGAVPSPLPEGKTAEDYTGFYGTVTGQYQYTLFGPHAATCDLTADQVCAAAEIEGCDYGWGCSPGRWWYRFGSAIYDSIPACTGSIVESTISYGYACLTEDNLSNPYHMGACQNGVYSWLVSGPLPRRCDVTQ